MIPATALRYSLIIANVGLLTTSFTCKTSHKACIKVVLPEPISPCKAQTEYCLYSCHIFCAIDFIVPRLNSAFMWKRITRLRRCFRQKEIFIVKRSLYFPIPHLKKYWVFFFPPCHANNLHFQHLLLFDAGKHESMKHF